jgi:pyridoxal 5-phosphate dependent beta-lyase
VTDPGEEWAAWRQRRPEFRGIHLDSAAAGRSSLAVLEAVAAHARLESEVGGYVAADQAEPAIEHARATLARLLGMPADGLAFVTSGHAALIALLDIWPIQPGDTIGVPPSEWGPNRQVLEGHGLRLVDLPVDGSGHIDLDGLEQLLRASPPAVVHLTQVAAHRGLVQPVAEAATICRAAGVPLWVDAAQALGHVDTDCGADAIFATSRKWLTGPRGVGLLAVAQPWWSRVRFERPALAADGPVMRWVEWGEAHVAGRVGLGVAVEEFLADGPSRIWARLADVGAMTRAELADLPGWRVLGSDDPCSTTALEPTDGQDVAATRQRLLAEHGILTTASQPVRAPRDMRIATLRVSPHVDGTPEDLRRLRAALTC